MTSALTKKAVFTVGLKLPLLLYVNSFVTMVLLMPPSCLVRVLPQPSFWWPIVSVRHIIGASSCALSKGEKMVIDLIEKRQQLRREIITAAWEVVAKLQDELQAVEAKIKAGERYEPLF